MEHLPPSLLLHNFDSCTCGYPSLYITHVMAHFPALREKTKQFHQVTSRKYYYSNNLSHVIALQNQPLCTGICYRKQFYHLKVHRHGLDDPCLSYVGQALKASTVQACRRNLIVMTLNLAQTLTILFILLSCTRTRESLHTSIVFGVACA